MINWYNFKPSDTLVFRGGKPMLKGTDHTADFRFPPPPQTIIGALRTAFLVENNISFNDYIQGKNISDEIYNTIGKPDNLNPFRIVGPLFLFKNQIFIPVPYTWFTDKESLEKVEKQGASYISIYKSKSIKADGMIKSNMGNIFWVKGRDSELECLGGNWVSLDTFKSVIKSKSEETEFKYVSSNKEILKSSNLDNFILKPAVLYTAESHTGIALDQTRKVREHHLYSFQHYRLQKEVSLIFGVDRELKLKDAGILKLGAEQRFGEYRKIDLDIDLTAEGQLYMSLSLLEGSKEANENLIATGKIQYIGGWDLAKKFHKPMKGYFPPGTVFRKKIEQNCICLR